MINTPGPKTRRIRNMSSIVSPRYQHDEKPHGETHDQYRESQVHDKHDEKSRVSIVGPRNVISTMRSISIMSTR